MSILPIDHGIFASSAVSGAAAAGYFGGGNDGSTVTTVDRFLFSDDSRTTLGTGLATGHFTGTIVVNRKRKKDKESRS